MNSRQLGRLGLALLGVYALIVFLSELTTLIAIASTRMLASFAIAGIPIAVIAVLSYALVFHNDRVAGAILPDADEAVEAGHSDLSRVFVVLLGALVLLQALPTTVNALFAYLAAVKFGAPAGEGVAGRLLGTVLQIGIAGYLIARPERLLAFARKPLPE